MNRILTSVLTLAFAASMASGASAKSCRDAKGKFMKCKTATAAKAPCRDKKTGKFTKCSSSMSGMKM